MPTYSTNSLKELSTCDARLQDVFKKVGDTYNCTIIQGHRGEAEQNKYYYLGRSKVKYPHGAHNKTPSYAVDAAPYIPGRGIPWPQKGTKTFIKDYWEFVYFAGHVVRQGETMGYKIRWGGDWDKDRELGDNKFDDLVHFEIID